MHRPEEVRKEKKKKQRSKSHDLIISLKKKKKIEVSGFQFDFSPLLLLYERPRQTTKPGKIRAIRVEWLQQTLNEL